NSKNYCFVGGYDFLYGEGKREVRKSSIRSTRCLRFSGAEYSLGQNSTIFEISPSTIVKNEITLALCTPSVTQTSLTASLSLPTIRLISNFHLPCEGYSSFIAARLSRPRILSFD